MNLINQDTCKQCHLCISICPSKILQTNSDKQVFFFENKMHTCLRCGQCMAVCETQSIQIEGLTYERNIFELPPNDIGYDQLQAFLAHRRSVRNFKDTPIPNAVIDKILETTNLAPFGAAPHAVNITAINDRRRIEEALPHISQFYTNLGKWMRNPFMRFMIKRNAGPEQFNTIKHHLLPRIKLGHYNIERSGDNITRNAPALIILHAPRGTEESHEDGYINLTYCMLAAHSLGLGTTVIGLIPPALNKVRQVREIFGIPHHHQAIASMILGYPKYRLRNGIRRLV